MITRRQLWGKATKSLSLNCSLHDRLFCREIFPSVASSIYITCISKWPCLKNCHSALIELVHRCTMTKVPELFKSFHFWPIIFKTGDRKIQIRSKNKFCYEVPAPCLAIIAYGFQDKNTRPQAKSGKCGDWPTQRRVGAWNRARLKAASRPSSS